ncbi:MAG: CDP-alcohol phosphatidyltransferase family protein [Phycisphaerales bacterium]|nr:CDP-alcohol phosphatidyltransferase family protein [Phycisphaerales bacterium]
MTPNDRLNAEPPGARESPELLDPPALAERDERPPLRAIALLPSAATLGNLICGFIAVFLCLLEIRAAYSPAFPAQPRVLPHLQAYVPSYIAYAAYLIIAAMIFDALDGRLARIARRTTEFGAQLDSIADVVSFGVAPTAMYLTILLHRFAPADADPTVSAALWRIGLIGGLVYLSCAAIRLARYNAENIRDESAARKFSGLPTPGAAAGFTALLLLHEQWVNVGGAFSGSDGAAILRWAIAPVAFGLGMLMVSRLDYVHVFNVYVRREHPPTHLVALVVIAVATWYSPEITLTLGAFAYIVSGMVLNLRRRRNLARGGLPASAHVNHHN